MRGVRLPLPKQAHRVHLTARDSQRRDRPTSRTLLDSCDPDESVEGTTTRVSSDTRRPSS